MILMYHLLLAFDPSQNRENQLNAIQPLFNSPSAIKVLMKTSKFEGMNFLAYTATEDKLNEFLQRVERLDVTDWLSFDFPKLKEVLNKLAADMGISVISLDNDTIVLGDPPDKIEGAVAKKKKKKLSYPPDIPEKNYWLWDDVKKGYRSVISKRGGRDPDTKEAITRILYYNSAVKLNVLPFSFNTMTQITDARIELAKDIEDGEDKASSLIEVWERHLKSDGTLKKTKSIKYLGSDFKSISSRFYIAHVVEWTVSSDWKTLSDYLKKNHGFHSISKDHLSININRITQLEVIYEGGNKVSIYISHVLTPHQAATLTGKDKDDAIVKMLHKYATQWYKNGKFPDITKV